MRPWEVNARNLAESLSFYGPVERTPGVDLITSRVAYSVFNIALLNSPVSELDGELERRIRVAAAHYGKLNRQWSFWVCDDFLPRRVSRLLMKTFELHGLHCIADSPGMESPGLKPPRRKLPAIEVLPVEDDFTRASFTRIVSACFHIPPQIAQLVYEHEDAWQGAMRAVVGFYEGKAVCSAALVEHAGALGIYSVATLPEYRCRGLAEAVMRRAIERHLELSPEPGPLVLQSSPAGLELYRRLGFTRTTRFFVFSTT